MNIEHTSNGNAPNNYYLIMMVTVSSLVLAPTITALFDYNPSLAAAQSSNPSQHISPSNSTSTYLKKLQKNEGSNSQIIANNTKIGTGHTFQTFGKEHKVKGSTPQSIKALPLHPKLRNMTAASAGGGGNKTGGGSSNMSASTANSTKK